MRWTGTNVAEVFAAPFDVTLIGNECDNNLKGRAGNDTLIGGLGFDTAVFSFPRASYDVRFEGDTVIVEDALGGREGTDKMTGVERLQFSDEGINLQEIGEFHRLAKVARANGHARPSFWYTRSSSGSGSALVCRPVFKAGEGLVNSGAGGFDSHALPPSSLLGERGPCREDSE